MSIQCCTVHAETIVNITMFKYFCLTGIPPHLSFFYKCIHTHGYLFAQSSSSIPCQNNYQKKRIIHSSVHWSLLKEERSDVKVKHWYFIPQTGNLNYEFILVVIMPDANGNSVTIIVFARVKIFRGSLKF